MNERRKKIIVVLTMFFLIITLLILSIVCLAKYIDKPSKKTATKLVETYLEAINENDGTVAMSVIDAEGYAIYEAEGEAGFDKTYKKKKLFFEEYYEDNDYEGLEDYKDHLSDSFENNHKYNSYEYSLGKIISIEKSKDSKKIYIIKVKVKKQSSYTFNSETMKFYVIKINGKYKIIGM